MLGRFDNHRLPAHEPRRSSHIDCSGTRRACRSGARFLGRSVPTRRAAGSVLGLRVWASVSALSTTESLMAPSADAAGTDLGVVRVVVPVRHARRRDRCRYRRARRRARGDVVAIDRRVDGFSTALSGRRDGEDGSGPRSARDLEPSSRSHRGWDPRGDRVRAGAVWGTGTRAWTGYATSRPTSPRR